MAIDIALGSLQWLVGKEYPGDAEYPCSFIWGKAKPGKFASAQVGLLLSV